MKKLRLVMKNYDSNVGWGAQKFETPIVCRVFGHSLRPSNIKIRSHFDDRPIMKNTSRESCMLDIFCECERCGNEILLGWDTQIRPKKDPKTIEKGFNCLTVSDIFNFVSSIIEKIPFRIVFKEDVGKGVK